MSDGTGIIVVMPVYGPGPHLEQAIAALRNQSPPVSRIVISHSGEGNPTARFAGVPGVTVLHSPERLYAGAARNRGFALAETDWVAFIDEDIIVGEKWHAALQAAIAGEDSDCFVGSIGCASSGGYWGMSLWFTEFGPVHPYLAAKSIASGASANLAVKSGAMRGIGGFPEDWRVGEDALAQARLEKSGCRIRFDPAIVANHHNREGMREVLRYSLILGLNSARLRRVHPHLTGGAAVRWPVLSLGLAPARLVQIYRRVLGSRGAPLLSLLYHTPGILAALLAWNAGFTAEAFRAKPQAATPGAGVSGHSATHSVRDR